MLVFRNSQKLNQYFCLYFTGFEAPEDSYEQRTEVELFVLELGKR